MVSLIKAVVGRKGLRGALVLLEMLLMLLRMLMLLRLIREACVGIRGKLSRVPIHILSKRLALEWQQVLGGRRL